ncbi:MAG: hypothetical protein ACRDNW_15175 [Trebonia sp.]
MQNARWDPEERRAMGEAVPPYGYPPDAQRDAIQRVLDQTETFADDWSPTAGM